jgi:Mg-chelatase subunit ChlD
MRGAATAASIVALTLATPEAGQFVFRARTDVVVIDAAVKDGSRIVTGLTRDDFVLRDKGVVQTILDFERERRPLDVTLAIDVSGSMVGSKRVAVEHAIAAIGAALEPADRVGVITFDTQVREIAPLAAPPMSAELKSGSGGTAVIDAVLLSLATTSAPDRRQLTIVMTDGVENSSEFDPRVVRRTATYTSTQMSFVVTRPTGRFGQRWNEVRSMLEDVAETTGGQVVELKPDEQLSDAFLTALEDFRTSYVLRYQPTGVDAAGWHDVTVAVKGRNYSVRARRGYWGPA